MIKIKKNAQGAIEFIVLFAGVLFFFIVFFGVVQKNISEKNQEKEKIILQNIALDVKDEINLAAESSEGYFREFKIPLNILGKEYNITLVNNFVYVEMETIGFAYKIFNIEGEIIKGVNNITKKDGTVYINE